MDGAHLGILRKEFLHKFLSYRQRPTNQSSPVACCAAASDSSRTHSAQLFQLFDIIESGRG